MAPPRARRVHARRRTRCVARGWVGGGVCRGSLWGSKKRWMTEMFGPVVFKRSNPRLEPQRDQTRQILAGWTRSGGSTERSDSPRPPYCGRLRSRPCARMPTRMTKHSRAHRLRRSTPDAASRCISASCSCQLSKGLARSCALLRWRCAGSRGATAGPSTSRSFRASDSRTSCWVGMRLRGVFEYALLASALVSCSTLCAVACATFGALQA